MEPIRNIQPASPTPETDRNSANDGLPRPQRHPWASARAEAFARDMRSANAINTLSESGSVTQLNVGADAPKRRRIASWIKGGGDPASAFSKDVAERIREGKAQGATTLDLTAERIRLQQLRSYFALLPTVDPETLNRMQPSTQPHNNTHPQLLISKNQLARELLAEEPTRRESAQEIIVKLLAYPKTGGGITLTEDNGRHTLFNEQVDWLKGHVSTANRFSGLWQILDAYRRNHLTNTYKGDFFYDSLKPFFDRYREFGDEDHCRRRLTALDDFFGKLSATREYQNPPTQPLITSRAYWILQQMQGSDLLFDEILSDAEENLTNCQDRRAVVLLDMEMRCQLHDLMHGHPTEAELFATGMKYLRLSTAETMAWQELVDLPRSHALDSLTRHEQATNASETVEMILFFRTHLSDMGLPSNCNIMQHAVGQFTMPDNFAQQMREKIEQSTHDQITVQHFFQNWEPWRHHLKQSYPEVFQKNDEIAYNALEKLHAQSTQHRSHYWNHPSTVATANTIAKARQEKEDELITKLSQRRISQLHQAFLSWTTLSPLHPQTDGEIV